MDTKASVIIKHSYIMADYMWNTTDTDISQLIARYGHAKLKQADVRDLITLLLKVFDQCQSVYSDLEIVRTESLYTMIKVNNEQYTKIYEALEIAKRKLNFQNPVDVFVALNPSPNACSFKLPNQTSEIILNSGLVELLELLEEGNENYILVVLLHELGHLMFRQSDIATGMRIYTALLNDGSITKSVLLEEKASVYRRYCVAMEGTSDIVMHSVMHGMDGGWEAIVTVFGKLAGGVRGFPINCQEVLDQYASADDSVRQCLYAGVTNKDAHPPIMFRLHELSLHHEKLKEIKSKSKTKHAEASKPASLWD